MPALLRDSITAVARGQWTSRPLFGDGVAPLMMLFRYPQHVNQSIRHFSITSKPFRRRLDGVGLLQCHSAVGILIPLQIQTLLPATSPPRATFATSKNRRPKPQPPARPPKGNPPPNRTSLPSYDPDKGVPFRATPLTPSELSKIFPSTVSPPLGNLTLKIQHGRRLHGLLSVPDSEFPLLQPHLAEPALKWLRENYPIDEEAVMEGEEERELRERAERLGLYYKPQEGVKGGSVYGKSGLEVIRETYEKEEKRKEKENARKKKEMEDSLKVENKQSTTIQPGNSGRVGELTEQKEPEWVAYYRERATVTKDTSPPEMSKFRRLFPSTLLLLPVLLISYFLLTAYTAPTPTSRLFPDTPPTATTLLTLISLNSITFLLWRFPPAWPFLNRYFISVPGYPFAWSLLGNMFSHQQVRHLLMNMLVLWVVGTRVHEDVGRGGFLGVYFAGGALGSWTSLVAAVLGNRLTTSSLGASGAVAGILAAWFSIHWNEGFKLLFVPEDWLPQLSGMGVLAALVGVELVGVWRGWRRVDHWAHLGGYGGGLVGAWIIGEKRRVEEERRKKRGEKGWLDRVREGRW
ncbi:hypothetical protein FGG08_004775 [Glutinoglossum americanum]|uniref:Peptidase S54 rhomboid domain-containing protein n=1 Tax=Glutinoglossum americanum TaxID=1670608 RepID=A0A9P8HVS6_9PEZI|nr:hypothetical protein FGG08_004775 [Glutinoglossum americanum]